MNSLAISNFNFQGVTLKPVERAGDLWFSSADLAKALGYKKTDAVTQIYSRYSDEFGANMSTTLRDPMAHQTLAASLINPLIGYDAIPLPVIEEHYHTAGEVGEMLGVSAQKIGRVANANNLKTEQNGKFFLDKSAHSSKQVEAFRYNAEGVKALRHLIVGADVA